MWTTCQQLEPADGCYCYCNNNCKGQCGSKHCRCVPAGVVDLGSGVEEGMGVGLTL